MPYNNYYPYNQPYIPQTSGSQPFLTRVRDEQDVINFPVAPGVTAFFIDENAQIIFSKTMDASQLDRPRIVKFKRVPDEKPVTVEYATKDELSALRSEIVALLHPVVPTAPTGISNGMPAPNTQEVKSDEHASV